MQWKGQEAEASQEGISRGWASTAAGSRPSVSRRDKAALYPPEPAGDTGANRVYLPVGLQLPTVLY